MDKIKRVDRPTSDLNLDCISLHGASHDSLKLMRKSILSFAKDCALFDFALFGALCTYLVGEIIIACGPPGAGSIQSLASL